MFAQSKAKEEIKKRSKHKYGQNDYNTTVKQLKSQACKTIYQKNKESLLQLNEEEGCLENEAYISVYLKLLLCYIIFCEACCS